MFIKGTRMEIITGNQIQNLHNVRQENQQTSSRQSRRPDQRNNHQISLQTGKQSRKPGQPNNRLTGKRSLKPGLHSSRCKKAKDSSLTVHIKTEAEVHKITTGREAAVMVEVVQEVAPSAPVEVAGEGSSILSFITENYYY